MKLINCTAPTPEQLAKILSGEVDPEDTRPADITAPTPEALLQSNKESAEKRASASATAPSKVLRPEKAKG